MNEKPAQKRGKYLEGVKPYFIGKTNSLMMRTALHTLNAHLEESVMIGDNMTTDIISGMEAAYRPFWYSLASPARNKVERFPYRPTWIRESLGDVEIS